VPVHDAVGRRQPQATPLPYRAGGEEGLEDTRAGCLVHTAAIVLHLNHQAPALEVGTHGDRARAAPEGLTGIVEQGLEYLAEQGWIHRHGRQGPIAAYHLLIGVACDGSSLDGLVEKLCQ